MRLKELIKQTLFKPLDASGLSVFRIFFGIVMLWETARYFQNDWIKGLINLDYHFTYSWFRWVKPVKEEWMVFLFGILAAAAILVTFGLLYEIAAAIIFFIFLYVFLIEPFFVNHFYLIVLLSFLLIFISSNKQYSLDRLIWRKNGDAIIPAWQLFLLQFQVGVVYFYGGIAKINYDWLVYSEPMKHLLAERTDYPLLGSLFKNPWAAYFISWSGLILDL
ncbi:MAG TPA: HTTM domain-containing protein, partial [Chitinophagales bacterium]|nr:HTTM domain-containing protein [Chitinophagales bacterium]